MRVAIVGAHPATRLGAPYQRTDWTIWACSALNMKALPRWDAWFELHVPFAYDVRRGQVDETYAAWLRSQSKVYVRDPAATFAGTVAYPEAAMRAKFGSFFFTSSIACMFAKAISQNPAEIGLWGIGMHKADEYADQRPGCHYFVQRAWDQGITVTSPHRWLLEPPKEQW